MSKEKEILDKELSFNYGDELDKIQNHISTLRFVAISSVNSLEEKDKEIERLNNIINELEKLELYEFTPNYDYDENLVEGYTPFNIREYIQELKGSDK